MSPVARRALRAVAVAGIAGMSAAACAPRTVGVRAAPATHGVSFSQVRAILRDSCEHCHDEENASRRSRRPERYSAGTYSRLAMISRYAAIASPGRSIDAMSVLPRPHAHTAVTVAATPAGEEAGRCPVTAPGPAGEGTGGGYRAALGSFG